MLREMIVRSKIGQEIKKAKDIYSHGEEIAQLKKETCSLISELESIDIPVLFFGVPKADRIRKMSEAQRDRIKNWTFDFNNIDVDSANKLKAIYPEKQNIDYIQQVYDGVKVYSDGYARRLADFKSKYVNIVNGERLTSYQPESYEKTIYIFGSCTARGTGVEDKETIESYLQVEINKEKRNIRVSNKGVGCGYFLDDDFLRIRELSLHSGDIVVILEPFELWQEYSIKSCTSNFFDTSSAFNNFMDIEWFTDYTGHTTSSGNQQIAKTMLNIIKEKKVLDIVADPSRVREGYSPDIAFQDELKSYIDYLKTYRNNMTNNGAIVMNCNPFTYGHRYLIEQASKQVDTLYVFVVEEDKSYFKFSDRIELVKLGTKDIANVVVLQSGKFIISALTFPGYFMKDSDPTIKVDTTNDLRIFGQYIAPTLAIKKRFAGEEPIDMVTRQYNDNMKNILPRYDIDFVEIPRKMEGDSVISASRVRKLISENNFSQIANLVPETTLKYLVDNFGEKNGKD